jgi:hypothetical protein
VFRINEETNMALTPEDLYSIEAAGIPLPDWAVASQDRAIELNAAIPEAMSRLLGTGWDNEKSDVDNLVEAGRSVSLKSQRGEISQYLNEVADAIVPSDIVKHQSELFDHVLAALRDLQADIRELIAVPGVSEWANSQNIEISAVPTKSIKPILAARDALNRGTEMLRCIGDLFYNAGVPLGAWLIFDPAPFSVSDWLAVSGGGANASAQPRGVFMPYLQHTEGTNLRDAALPESFAELRARERMIVSAEKNSGSIGRFFDDDPHTISALSSVEPWVAPMATSVGVRRPPETLTEFDALDTQNH